MGDKTLMDLKECLAVTKIARVAQNQRMVPTAKTRPAANVPGLPMKVEAIHSKVTVLMTRMPRIKTKNRKTMNSTTLELVTYQAPLRCNRSLFLQLMMNVKNMKASSVKTTISSAKSC